MTVASPGSMWRKSRRSAKRRSSATAPAISTPVGPPPTTTKVEICVPAHRVRLPLGQLEGQQHPLPDLDRVLQTLESGCQRLPVVMAEVGVSRAGGDDQVVVGHVATHR